MLMLVLYLSVKEVAMHVTLTGWHKTAGAAGAGAAGGTDPYTRTVADHTDRLARPIPAAAASPYQTGERAYEGARVCVCVCVFVAAPPRLPPPNRGPSPFCRRRTLTQPTAGWLSRRYLVVIGSPGPWSADSRVGRRSRFATLTLSRQIEQHIPPHSSYKWMATYFVT